MMTTLDVILASEYSTPNIRQWEKLYKPACAELAQLRADVAALQEANEALEPYAKLAVILNASSAAGVISAVEEMYGELAEQARQLEAARRERDMAVIACRAVMGDLWKDLHLDVIEMVMSVVKNDDARTAIAPAPLAEQEQAQ